MRISKGAFTLIELLIVITLLVMMGAVAAIELGAFRSERQFNEALEQIRAAMMIARHEAMARREALEVIAVSNTSTTTSLIVRSFGEAVELTMQSPDDAWPIDDGRSAYPAEPEEQFSKRLLTLPRGLSIRHSISVDSPMQFEQTAAEVNEVAPEEILELRLAVYLPDGSAVGASGVEIVSGKRFRASIGVSRLTGVPSFEQLARDPAMFAESTEQEPADEGSSPDLSPADEVRVP